MFVAEGYSLIDEERREGGTKNRSTWNLKTLLAERSTKERNKRAKTKTGLPGRLQKGRSQYIMCQSWWRNQILNLTATHCLISIVSVLFPKPVLFTTSKKPMSKSGKGYFAIHFHKIVAQNDDHPVYHNWSLAYSMMGQICKVFFGSTKKT